MDRVRLISHPHSAGDQARDARARAWAYVFQCWQEKQNAAGAASTNGGDATMRNSKGVSHVNQRPG